MNNNSKIKGYPHTIVETIKKVVQELYDPKKTINNLVQESMKHCKQDKQHKIDDWYEAKECN